jgi:hypothetical protein
VVMCERVASVDLEALTEQLPESFLPAALRAIYLGRRQAWDHCASEFTSHEARNVRPFYARGKIEGLLRDVAAVTPGCVATTVEESGWSHVELTFERLTVTCHTVQTPCAMVDGAEYRLDLASANEPRLFELADAADPDHVYAVLVHSTYRGRPMDVKFDGGHLPGSVYLAIPNAGLKSYAHRVNLFDRYPGIVRSNLPADWSEEAEVKYYFWQARQRAA